MSSTNSNSRLYIGNLPGRVNPHQIADALVEFKNAAVCVFNPSIKAQRGSSYAFVTLEDGTDLDAAVLKLSGLKIGNRTIAVAKADPNKKKEPSTASAEKDAKTAEQDKEEAAKQPKPEAAARPARKKLPQSEDTVYVSNIPLEVDASEIDALFKEFDGATTIITKDSRKRRQGNRVVVLAPKSYAFVKVGAGNQDKAIEALNDTEFKGEKLVVSKATVSPEELEQEPAAEPTAEPAAEPAAN